MYNKPSIGDYYRSIKSELEQEVLRLDDKYVLETATSEIISRITNGGKILSPIELDASQKETMRHEKEIRTVPANRRDSFYRDEGDLEMEYETLIIRIPIKDNHSIRNIMELGTSTFTISWSPDKLFNVTPNFIEMSLDIKGYQLKLEDDQIVSNVNQLKQRLNEWMGWIKKDIQQEEPALLQHLSQYIDQRKKKLSEDGGHISLLSDKMGIQLQ